LMRFEAIFFHKIVAKLSKHLEIKVNDCSTPKGEA
jgi:hypothetical protein